MPSGHSQGTCEFPPVGAMTIGLEHLLMMSMHRFAMAHGHKRPKATAITFIEGQHRSAKSIYSCEDNNFEPTESRLSLSKEPQKESYRSYLPC